MQLSNSILKKFLIKRGVITLSERCRIELQNYNHITDKVIIFIKRYNTRNTYKNISHYVSTKKIIINETSSRRVKNV